MRVMVTGASGMLGSSLLPVLDDAGHSVSATDIRNLDSRISELDVRRLPDMLRASEQFKPEILVHLAAETDLEVCESRVDYAYQENFIGTQNACVLCRTRDIPLVYISTAGVFDGLKEEPYTELDNPNPINTYGKSKFEGERIVRQTVPSHYIVRAGWMVGGGERDRKFVSKIIHQIDSGATTLHAVTDRRGTPTYAPAFSKVIERLMRSHVYGTYHLACKGKATRFDVAKRILSTLGRDDISLKPVTSDYFKQEYFAPRPLSEEMRNYVLELRGADEMPRWEDAIDEYLKTQFSSFIR